MTALEALYGHYAKTFELWEEEGIGVPPVFIVVCNNKRYEAMRKGHELYYPQGAAVSTNSHHGVFIAGPAYEDLGSHFGFFGAKAKTASELRSAFEGGLAALAEGRTAILNVSLVK
jgi:thiamine pyrophosphate-dependent acetolactate synthase large subunit-like protein